MVFLTVLIIVVAIVFCIHLSIEWAVHLEITKGDCTRYGWASYNKFKREFVKYDWERMYSNSCFKDYSNDCKFHASIIKFNGIGMLMRTPVDFYLANRFVKKKMKQTNYEW